MSLVEYLRYLIEEEKTMAIVETVIDNPALQTNIILEELFSLVSSKPKLLEVLFG